MSNLVEQKHQLIQTGTFIYSLYVIIPMVYACEITLTITHYPVEDNSNANKLLEDTMI